MDYYDLDGFIDEIDTLLNFFSEMSAKEEELLTFGMQRVTAWKSYDNAKKLFVDFDTKTFELVDLAHYVDAELTYSIQEFLKDSKIVDLIGSIDISLRIAEKKTNSIVFLRVFLQLPYIGRIFRKKRLFAEETISIRDILVALNRLISYSKRLKSIYDKNRRNDNDIFKPSNLDNKKILVYIENAILNIENSAISEVQRKELIAYLFAAKTELGNEYLSWSKIVGALVITATILGGIAEAPKAYQNVSAAIQYILKGSVEKYSIPALPILNTAPIKQDSVPGETIV